MPSLTNVTAILAAAFALSPQARAQPQYKTFCDWVQHRDELTPGQQDTIDQVMIGSSDCTKAGIAIVLRFKKPDIDLSPLASLTDLQDAIFKVWDFIPDLTPMAGLTGLTELEIDANRSQAASTRGVESIGKLTHLTYMEVHDINFQGNTAWLSGLKSLAHLYIDATDFGPKDMLNLMPLYQSLRELSMYSGGMVDLAPLGLLVNLRKINLSGNQQLANALDVRYLLNLKDLTLDNDNITDVTALADLSLLSTLNLSNNKITSVAPLAKLQNLTSLSIDHNPVADVSPLANLKQLTYLDVTGLATPVATCPNAQVASSHCVK